MFLLSTARKCHVQRLGSLFNTLRPRQDGRHFADDIFKCIFFNEKVWIPIKISLKFVPKDPINNIPALVQIMAWRRPGDKLLSEPMVASFLTHICVTRPQWVKSSQNQFSRWRVTRDERENGKWLYKSVKWSPLSISSGQHFVIT